jgi:hypothetical protein
MGWIPSHADLTQKATFGFVFVSDGTTYSFSGSYHDKAAGIDLKGSGVLKPKPPPPGVRSDAVCVGGLPTYESTNRDKPGEGVLDLTVCDLENAGVGLGDVISITVMTGPFAEYFNFGFPSGNITVTCRDDCDVGP